MINKYDRRYSFASWVRYEEAVANWLAVYPEPYEFQLKGFSTETVMSRIRDAVKAKLELGYPSALVDHDKLKHAWPNVVVGLSSTQEGYVRIGAKDLKTPLVSEPLAISMSTTVAPTLEALLDLAKLINNNTIKHEIHVEQCDSFIRKQFEAEIPNYMNVAMIPLDPNDPLGTFVLL